MSTGLTLSRLTNEELLRIATAEVDSLTSTPLEVELLKRFGDLLDIANEHDQITSTVDNSGGDPDDLAELVKVLEEFSCLDPKGLRQKLERSDKFYDIATEAGDVVHRLAQLINATT